MSARRTSFALAALALVAAAAVRAGELPADSLALEATEAVESSTPAPARTPRPLEALVPDVARNVWGLDAGERPYRHRIAFSPGFGALGSERLFAFRLAYHPDDWLGWEGALEHNPAQSTHAVLHSVSALLRRPFAGRFQPYAALGYGMFMVFPGRALNADPVTKNALTMGGGLEFFIRNDLALRADLRKATVFGREKDEEGVVVYDYLEQWIGLVFYRSIAP